MEEGENGNGGGIGASTYYNNYLYYTPFLL